VQEAIDFEYSGGPPAEMIAASGADCFVVTTLASVSSEMRQAVLNLQPLVDADPAFPLDDYLAWALEEVRYGGDLWGLPAGVTVDVLWYNRTLFDEAGLPYPEGDWSWEDVFLAARRLSDDEEARRHCGFIFLPYRCRFASRRGLPGVAALSRRSLLTSDAFREQVGADAQAAYLEALECEEWEIVHDLDGLPPYARRAYVWLDQALEEILWQGADAQAALSQAQQKAEAYLDCLRRRSDLQDLESAGACFQEVDAP
jgi:ABC-type glycerol-3-phosphate transport system substrate-binding protein